MQISQPLAPLVDEFAQRLFRELDYEAEGRNAEQFQRLYADVPRVRRKPCAQCSTTPTNTRERARLAPVAGGARARHIAALTIDAQP